MQNIEIGKIKLKNPIIIAPMAGITNGAFRELCFEFGAALVETEMVSDKAIYYMNQKTLKMLEVDDDYHPVSLQLFGADPDTMEIAAKKLNDETNCDIIDINMGCPVMKVIKSAAANATNNFGMDEDALYIAEIYANDGLKMKRFLPRAKGSASGLVKRSCHITCVVKMR